MHIVMTGNPVDGFVAIGPFDDHDKALEYAERECKDENWWIVPLDKP